MAQSKMTWIGWTRIVRQNHEFIGDHMHQIEEHVEVLKTVVPSPS